MIPGFLLLGSHLGDPERQILSPTQLRELTRRVSTRKPERSTGELSPADLRELGYDEVMARRILGLLEDRDRMELYLSRAGDCIPVTRGEEIYPLLVRRRLGGECPGCFFALGDPALLNTPAIALVGSRDLRPENREFAREAGYQAAAHGLTLISGNARGADRTAQEACLRAGGRVISVVADSLTDKKPAGNILYLSQGDYDAPFSAQRALSRNRIIHSMGYMTLVAQCSLGTGGTWSGTVRNLREGWSQVVCFRDSSPAALELESRGAVLVDTRELSGLTELGEPQLRLTGL